VIVIKTTKELQNYLNGQKRDGKTIGFVPTMGALHEGHLSLIKKSMAETDITVCSIFVNPTQFNNSTDLEKYPIKPAEDFQLLAQQNCTDLFMPSVLEMYPNGQIKNIEDYGNITKVFEGEKRPGHFDGVITVVSIFLEIIKPNKTFFGQKDYQQCLVVKNLINKNFPEISLFIEPTLRNENGLALSSRNAHLLKHELSEAEAISKALFSIKENWGLNTIEQLIENARNIISEKKSLKIEYLNICNLNDLSILSGNSSNYDEAVILTAVFCGEVRLIDNLIVYK